MLCVCLHLCFFTLTSRPEFLRGDKQQLSQGFVSFCVSSADMERTQWPSQPCQRHCLFFYLLYYSQCLHWSMYDGFKEVQYPKLKLLISCWTSFYSYSHQNCQRLIASNIKVDYVYIYYICLCIHIHTHTYTHIHIYIYKTWINLAHLYTYTHIRWVFFVLALVSPQTFEILLKHN